MEKKLIWLDLEMTGLDPNAERIIEIYTCITNEDLTEIIEGPWNGYFSIKRINRWNG